MKRFIVRSAAFALLVVVVIGGVCAWEIVAEIGKYHEELQAPEGASVLVCNDSQTGNGIDSEMCPEFFNFSAHGRALDQAYLTMLDVLRYNPKGKIRTVVFDVSPSSAVWPLRQPLPKMGFPAKYWLLHYLHRDENIRPLAGGLVVARDNLVGRRLRHFWRAVRGKVEFHSSLEGSFTPMAAVDKEEFPARYWGLLKGKAAASGGQQALTLESSFIVDVLDKVVACAKTEGVKLLVITTPWNEDLRNACTAAEMDAFTAVMKRFAESRQCEYADFLRLKLDDKCWGDGNHLNRNGAQAFTRILQQTLKERKML